MAPGIAHVAVSSEIPTVKKGVRQPLKSSGSLKDFEKVDLTCVIGTEFGEGVQLAKFLEAPNADELLRDLALLGIYLTPTNFSNETVSQRGVVFFRSQEITSKQQERIGIKLGELSGKPSTSKLHIHPLTEEFSEFGDYISVISAEFNRISHDADLDDRSLLASGGWHSEYNPYTKEQKF
jgi:hypothetical protein